MPPCTRAQRKRAREEEEEEEKRCRLCYGGEEDGPLVQPCACRGSAKLIHKHCLEHMAAHEARSGTQPTAAASARTSTATR